MTREREGKRERYDRARMWVRKVSQWGMGEES